MFSLFKSSKAYTDLNTQDFKAKIKEEPKAVILDVRTPEEVGEGTVPHAKNINFFSSNFKQDIAKLDKDRPYFVYCRSGARSAKACNVMTDMGFSQVYNLQGGYMAYR